MPDTKRCPQCGVPMPLGALTGLCPACLLREGAAADTEPIPNAGPFQPPSVEAVARLFPRLEIARMLGSGGMGAVYQARQPELDRWVALKIMAPPMEGGAGFAERFTREARTLAQLNHPNIVGLYEFGQIETLHYFIMEFIDVPSLRQLQQNRLLSPREALQIVPQICDALQYAHDEGIVHRDIKPENVLIDRKGRVKIADFGLAKILGRDPAVLRLTREGQVMGTPHYMAPEQLEHPLEVDHRADIYSLGVVFYEMLTGELPLGKFPPPSCRVEVDVRLDEVVLKALEKEPTQRYQRARQVKTAVEGITGSSAQSEPPPAVITPSRPGGPDLWLGVFLLSVCMIAAGTGIRNQDFLLWLAGMLGGGGTFLYFVRTPGKGSKSFDYLRVITLIGLPLSAGILVRVLPRDETSSVFSGLLALTIVCLGWGLVTLLRIRQALEQRGIDTGNPLFMGLMLFRHIPQYTQMTRRETGQVGPLLYHWIISMNGALVAGALVLLLRASAD